MKKFEFSIIASGLDPAAEDFEQRFYDAGCDDAAIAFQKGHIIVDFTREAKSIGEAIVTAVRNVQAAGARVDRVEPDPLVSLSDIAARSGMTRAAMTQYSKGQRAKDFPVRVARRAADGRTTRQHRLIDHAKLSRDEAIEAAAVRAANAAIGSRTAKLEETLKGSLKTYEKELDRAA